jgi:uncharacterized protein (DUF1800 family)
MKWSWETSRHLLSRAGFGGRREEVEKAHKGGLKATVEQLLSGPTRKLPVPAWLEEDRKFEFNLRGMKEEKRKERRRIFQSHARELIGGWVELMITSPTPADMLHQKMAFFWHGHFASSVQKVKAPPFIYDQLKLFYENALGNYGALLHGIIRDPAMLLYLDNQQNRKGKPNENLAREIMELFSLGVGNYTEQDIKEGARALTGLGIRPFEFVYNRRAHDDGQKTIFGKTGRWTGNDFVNLILEQPACAEYMVSRFWNYFGSEKIPNGVLKDLVAVFRDSKYDVKILLKSLFTHEHFYSEEVMASLIKSPVQLVVGTARTLGLQTSTPQFFGSMLNMMGQVPYFPPNVKGWPGGTSWIDTSRLVTRFTFAEIIGEGQIPKDIDPRMDEEISGAGDESMEMAENTSQSKPTEAVAQKEAVSPRQQKRQAFLKKKPGKGRGMKLPNNLMVDFDATRIAAGRTPEEIFDEVAELLLVIPPDAKEKQSILSTMKSAGEIDEAWVQKLIGRIMLLPAYQIC